MRELIRLDLLTAQRGISKSREQAKELIKAGCVSVDGKVVTKPSAAVSEESDIVLLRELCPYVSRGGLKLEKALEIFSIDVSDLVCVDIGASTGGFTDCLLQNGAKKVFAIDVGHGQLDKKLAENPAVVNLEGINVKDLSSDIIKEKVDIAVADLSFISLKNAFPAVRSLLKDNAAAVLLVKPQFEVGRQNIGKGGIVKSESAHISMLNDIIPAAESHGFTVLGLEVSPIKGGDGNIEYLMALKNAPCSVTFLNSIDIKKFVKDRFSLMK